MSRLSERRQEMQAALLARTAESFDTKDSSGKFAGFLNESGQGIPQWKCTAKEHMIDILPYVVGENNPNRRRPGDIAYVLILFTHDNIGTQDVQLICPARNYNKPCPICEEQKRLKDSGLEWDDPAVKALEPKKKTMYNILCYDTDEEQDKGIQLWTVAHWNFERIIVELAKEPRGGGYIPFSDADVGKTIAFRREGKGPTDTKYVGHRFVDRDYVIPDDVLDATYTLEDLIHIPTYEEIEEIFYAGAEGFDAQEHVPLQEPAPAPAPAPSGRVRRPVAPAVAPAPVEDDIPEIPAPAPVTRRAPTAREIANVAPVAGGNCPFGGRFGIDIDTLEECGTCAVWDDCLVAKENAPPVPAPAPATRRATAAPAPAPAAQPATAGRSRLRGGAPAPVTTATPASGGRRFRR